MLEEFAPRFSHQFRAHAAGPPWWPGCRATSRRAQPKRAARLAGGGVVWREIRCWARHHVAEKCGPQSTMARRRFIRAGFGRLSDARLVGDSTQCPDDLLRVFSATHRAQAYSPLPLVKPAAKARKLCKGSNAARLCLPLGVSLGPGLPKPPLLLPRLPSMASKSSSDFSRPCARHTASSSAASRSSTSSLTRRPPACCPATSSVSSPWSWSEAAFGLPCSRAVTPPSPCPNRHPASWRGRVLRPSPACDLRVPGRRR